MMDKNGNSIGMCMFKVVYSRDEQIFFSWKTEKVCLSRPINVMTEFHYDVRHNFFKVIILSTEIYIFEHVTYAFLDIYLEKNTSE